MKNKLSRAIDLQEYIPINGINQYLYHRGTNANNPVLLYLHGGPGSAESVISYLFQNEWEKIFTVVQWDQRGAGKTLTKNPDKLPTIDLMLEDLNEVVKYLKEKYHKQKIVLLGHSWGSVLGSTFIQQHPEDIAYYIGSGQVINMVENEQTGYDKVKSLINEAGDQKSLKKLKEIGDYPGKTITFDDAFLKRCSKVRKLQSKYQLSSDDSFLSVVKMIINSPIFQLSDFGAFMKIFKANRKVYSFLADFNLWNQPREYKIPVYYILGENDWQAPSIIAKKYFAEIVAPRKNLYMIPKARHMTALDQPELFFKALTDVYNREQEYNK